MHEYPKVLKYEHEKISEDFWSGDILITEKTDGTNIRLMLYDERFEDHYAQEVCSISPDHKDIIVGTRRNIRFKDSTPKEQIDGALHRIHESVQSIDKNKILDYHEDFEGPIVWFAEGMVKHSIDYNYEDDPPPALLGFDVYAQEKDSRDTVPKNPFDQTFEGFIPTRTAFNMLENVGIETVHSPNDLNSVDASSFEPDSYEIPKSDYTERTAEGVVLRNDGIEDGFSRAKIQSEEFQELNTLSYGYNEDTAENPEERFVAIFCSEARIRKIAQKMTIDEGREFKKDIIDDLWRRVYKDIWEEEYYEIKDLDFAFNPSKVKPIIAEQVAASVERIITNSELNDTEPTNIWTDY